MARRVGNGGIVNMGSDASIDNHATRTFLGWMRWTDTALAEPLSKSDFNILTPSGWQVNVDNGADDTGHVRVFQDFSTVDGTWASPNNSLTTNTSHHVGVTYNRGSTANDPDIYIDGSLQAEVETTPPAGASNGDAADSLRVLSNVGTSYAAHYLYDNTILTAADVNRHRWWGVAPGGPSTVDVWHPMWSEATTNKGTATANESHSGDVSTDNTSVPRVERMWGSMMGCGR